MPKSPVLPVKRKMRPGDVRKMIDAGNRRTVATLAGANQENARALADHFAQAISRVGQAIAGVSRRVLNDMLFDQVEKDPKGFVAWDWYSIQMLACDAVGIFIFGIAHFKTSAELAGLARLYQQQVEQQERQNQQQAQTTRLTGDQEYD